MNDKTYSMRIIQLLILIFSLILLNSVQASWNAGQKLPEYKKVLNIHFNLKLRELGNNKGLLYYKAASPISDEKNDKEIDWSLMKGQAAFLLILIPQGVDKLVVKINDPSLAGGKSVWFKNYHEVFCDMTSERINTNEHPAGPEIIISKPPSDKKDSEIKEPEWIELIGSSSYTHTRTKDEIKKSSDSYNKNNDTCLFLGYANKNNNYATGVEFRDVVVGYSISDVDVYKKWLGIDLLIDKPKNGKITINNKQVCDNSGDFDKDFEKCYVDDLPKDNEVTLTATAYPGYKFAGWDYDCKDENTNSISIKMDAAKRCSAKFIKADVPLPLALNLKTAKLDVGKITEIIITGGTAPYQASSANKNVATTEINDNKVTITGVAEGTTEITVTDNANNSVQTAVTVTGTYIPVKPLDASGNPATVVVGTNIVITITGGTKPYKASSDNKNVATTEINDNKVTITGVAEGTTEITVTDANGETDKVTVTVKKAGILPPASTEDGKGNGVDKNGNVITSKAKFYGGVSDDSGATYTAKKIDEDKPITVKVKIEVDPAHKDKKGKYYVVAGYQSDDMQNFFWWFYNENKSWVLWNPVSFETRKVNAYKKTNSLDTIKIEIVTDFSFEGFKGTYNVFMAYETEEESIYYNDPAIDFTIK